MRRTVVAVAVLLVAMFMLTSVVMAEGLKLPGDVGFLTGEAWLMKPFDITHESKVMTFDTQDTFIAESMRSVLGIRVEPTFHFTGFDVPVRYNGTTGKGRLTGDFGIMQHDIEAGVDIALWKGVYAGPLYQGQFVKQEIMNRTTGTVEEVWTGAHRGIIRVGVKW